VPVFRFKPEKGLLDPPWPAAGWPKSDMMSGLWWLLTRTPGSQSGTKLVEKRN
jgi:hypothetical protein